MLTREDIVRALEALALELPPTEHRTEIMLVGGAAMVLLFGARATTKDVDAIAIAGADAASIRVAVARVAASLSLPDDWLNDGAKGYLNGVAPGECVLDRPTLRVRAACNEQLLAMKLSAWRDDIDIADAALLLGRLPGTHDDVWRAVEPFVVPGRELKAQYAFDDLWEARDGHR